MSQPTQPTTETEPHYRVAGPSTMGRSVVYITCPFCGTEVRAYRWSLAGSGKKCPCGAKHDGYGNTTRTVQ